MLNIEQSFIYMQEG